MSSQAPKIRFKGFNKDWEQRKLGDVSTSFSGGTPSVSNKVYYDGKIPFIRSAEINSDSTELSLSVEGINNSSAKMVHAEDILYALYGATSGEVGISRITGAINQAILAIKPYSHYDSYFIMQWLRLQKQKIINKYLQGGQGNLSGSIVKSLEIPFPIYKEQVQIGKFFKKLDDTIALHQHALDLLKQRKKAFLQKMFPKKGEKTPDLRFSGFKDDWEIRKFGEIVDIQRGLTYKPSNVSDDGIRVLRSSNVKEDTFKIFDDDIYVNEDAVNKPLVNNGDIIVTAANGSTRLVGKHAVIENLNSKAVHGGFMLLIRSKNNYFINAWMSSTAYSRILNVVQGGNGAIGNLSKSMLDNSYITLPCEEEQFLIGNFFKELDNSIALQEEKLESLKQMKKAFLQKMFV